MSPRPNPSGRLVLAISLAAIAALTLVPEPRTGPALPVWCLRCGRFDLLDVLLNLALFVPFGVGLRLTKHGYRRALLLGFAVSLAVESAQLALPGRDASARDVAANTLGTLAGSWLASRWSGWWRIEGRPAAIAAVAWSLSWLVLVTACGWTLQLALPRGAYTRQVPPLRGAPPPIHGRVHRAIAAGSGPAVIDVDAEIDAPNAGRRTLAQFVGDGDVEAVLLMTDHDDLLVRPRLRAERSTLRGVTVRFPELLSPNGSGGHSIVARVTLDGPRVRVDASRGDRQLARQVTLRPSLGWALLLPEDWALDASARWVGLLWIAALLAPPGWLCSRAGDAMPRRVALALLAATTVIGLTIVPAAFGVRGLRVDEYLAALAGLVAGWRAGQVKANAARGS